MTNQEKFANMVKEMDPRILAEFLSDSDASFCYDCPAKDYCDRFYKVEESGWRRAPDENGEILECEDILERWFKLESEE